MTSFFQRDCGKEQGPPGLAKVSRNDGLESAEPLSRICVPQCARRCDKDIRLGGGRKGGAGGVPDS